MHNAAKLRFENRFCFVGLVFIKFRIKDAHFVLVFMPKNCSFFVFVKERNGTDGCFRATSMRTLTH